MKKTRSAMNSSFRTFLMALLFYCLLVVLAVHGTTYAAKKVPYLNRTRIQLKVGSEFKLKVYNNKDKVKWESSYPHDATVSKNGVVKAKHKGETLIYARTGGEVLKCHVTVGNKDMVDLHIVCVDLYPDKVTTLEYFRYKLYITNGGKEEWKWYLDNTEIAAFDTSNQDKSTFVEPGDGEVYICNFMGKAGTVNVTAKNGKMILKYKLDIQPTAKDRELLKLREEILGHVIFPGMSVQEKCLAVAKWICDYASYKVTDGPPYSLLYDRVGQCSHYAEIYKFLMDGINVPCVEVEDVDHAWNQVLIDGEWYNVDVTSMDTAAGSYGYSYYNFMVSDAIFWRKESRRGRYWGWRWNLHKCTSTRYDFPGLTSFQRHYQSPWADETWRNY